MQSTASKAASGNGTASAGSLTELRQWIQAPRLGEHRLGPVRAGHGVAAPLRPKKMVAGAAAQIEQARSRRGGRKKALQVQLEAMPL